MSINDKLLAIYLNDHLMGAVVGIDLAHRCRRENAGTPLGEALGDLLLQIREDRAQLEAVMAAVDIPADRLKLVAGSIAEKVARLKLNGRLLGYSDLSRLLELEGLYAGVGAKQRMWLSLALLADPRLERFDFTTLAERAASQLETIEVHRRAAAARALAR